MNHDEFAFFNQQLAAMLRSGIPLEGALKQLCVGMKTGPLRAELQLLEEDLNKGTPLKEALGRRTLPEFYLRMVEIGARSNDLPGVLTLLADHYQRVNVLWTRLKGLMVYPLIVLVVALGLTIVMSVLFGRFISEYFGSAAMFGQAPPAFAWVAGLWLPPVLIGLAVGLIAAVLAVPSWRARWRWRLPAFREASLAQLASALALMLKNQTPLAEALALAQALEAATPAGKTLAEWRRQVESGQGKPAQWPVTTAPFPPLFLWLVRQSGEDPATGFQKAAEIFQARATYRIELALYGALPVSILVLGLMIVWQTAPMLQSLIWLMNAVGGDGLGD